MVAANASGVVPGTKLATVRPTLPCTNVRRERPNLDMTSSSRVIFMGIPCRPRVPPRGVGPPSVRPVEFTGRETVFVACGVQRAGRRLLWRSREEKPKRPLDLWGPEARRPLRVGTTKQAFTPLDLHVDAAADNAMLVNFNAQQASASQVHGMKNRHIGVIMQRADVSRAN